MTKRLVVQESLAAHLVAGRPQADGATSAPPGAAATWSRHARMAQLFLKYRARDPDRADLALVWLAAQSGIRRIATLDVTDFSVYRLHGRTRFQLELLG